MQCNAAKESSPGVAEGQILIVNTAHKVSETLHGRNDSKLLISDEHGCEQKSTDNGTIMQ